MKRLAMAVYALGGVLVVIGVMNAVSAVVAGHLSAFGESLAGTAFVGGFACFVAGQMGVPPDALLARLRSTHQR